MTGLLLIVQVILAILLIGIVLIQRSDSDGTGLSGGASGGLGIMSGRGKSNALTRATAILAALFMMNSLALDILNGQHGSITDRIAPATDQPVSATPLTTPSNEPVPTTGATPPAAGATAPGNAPAPAPLSAPAAQ